MNIIYRLSRNLLGAAIAVAVAGSIVGCNENWIFAPSTPDYIQFSDTLYVLPVVDDEEYHNVPIVATKTCSYDRTVAVEIIDAASNAIEGRHYSLESNTITIKAGELVGNVRVRGYHNNIDVYDSLGFKLNLIIPEELQWDLYGTETNVLLKKACKFDINAFTGYCVLTSTYILNYTNTDMRLVKSEIDPEEENTIILRDYFFDGYDVKVRFKPEDIMNPLIEMDDQVFGPTSDAFGTLYGDGLIRLYQPTAYTSYFSSCEKFIFQYMTLYVPGMEEGYNTVGTFVNAVEWISDDEAEKLKREGY
ncbi:MAG: DUF4984 domain-containing protein [Bacteroidaceae bacterium]|nr:DUF4984 domain-containing protein [Bacteroidaceae bacterium]